MGTKPSDGYAALLADVSALYEAGRGPGVAERNRQQVLSYWDIGRRIVEDAQAGADKAGYGKQVIRRLSADMTARYGSGFSVRTLFDIRKLAVAYEREALSSRLNWTHFRTLLSVNDEARRSELEQLAVTQGLNATELQELARYGASTGVQERTPRTLVPRTARFGIYKVAVQQVGNQQRVLVDCGFFVKREIPLKGIRNPEDGTYVELSGTAASYRFEKIACEPGERYCYPGTVLEVVDGDTVTVRLDLGFGTFFDARIRLRGVNAPERKLEAGQKAQAFAAQRIRSGTAVTVLTYGQDVHGRFVGDVLYGKKDRFLNQEILDSGLATRLDMKS